MKNAFRFLVVTVVASCIFLAACDKRSTVDRDKLSMETLNTEEVLAEGQYPNLSQLTGHMTYKQLFDVLNRSLKTLNVLAAQGLTTKDDYQTLLNIINNLYNEFLRQEAESDDSMAESSQALVDLLQIASKKEVGTPLNQILKRTGHEILTDNVYPMLVYILSGDESLFDSSSGSVNIEGLDREKFKTIFKLTNNVLDKNGKYEKVHDKIETLVDTLKTTETNFTVGDVQDLASYLIDKIDSSDSTPTMSTSSTVDTELLKSVLTDVYNLIQDDENVKTDIKNLLFQAGLLLNTEINPDGKNSWDTVKATDFSRILQCTNDVLSANETNLKEFLGSALDGIAPTSDAATMKGLIENIVTINPSYISGVDKGLLSLFQNNMNGLPVGSSGINTSAIRSLIFMMQAANTKITINLLGYELADTLKLISSPDGGTVSGRTTNVAQWSVGEVVEAIKWAKSGSNKPGSTPYIADSNRDGVIDEFDALDWVLYKKRYQIAIGSLPLMSYNGLVGMMSDWINKHIVMSPGIVDPFAAFVELAGGDSNLAWSQRYGTAGKRHKIFALFAPLMKYFWDAGRAADTVNMMALLNEIDNPNLSYSSAYVPLQKFEIDWLNPFADPYKNDPNATFRTDYYTSALKTVEGPDGYGLLTYALRNRTANGTANNADGVLLDSLLDLVVRTVVYLQSKPASNGLGSQFDALMSQMGSGKMDKTAILNSLFKLDDKGKNLIERTQTILSEKHDSIATLAKPVGDILIALSDEDVFNQMIIDINTVRSLDINVALTSGSSSNGLMKYLVAKKSDGTDNPLIKNAKILATKILDINNANYNPNGIITSDTPLTGPNGFIVYLVGNGSQKGIYDLNPIVDFMTAATDDPDMLYTAVLSNGDMLKRVIGKESIRLGFIKALVTPVDIDNDGIVDDSVVMDILKIIKLEGVDMNGVLSEVTELMSGGDMRPGSDSFNMLVKTLEFVLQNIQVS